jgi:hypothetical protein
MSTKQITPEELALFKSYIVQVKYPAPGTQKADAKNAVTSAADYKAYPTAKNVPPSLKGNADQREKSISLPGYAGDVLKSDTNTREGKGVQTFANGTVHDGYFVGGSFAKGRVIDAEGTMITGGFINEKISGPGELKSSTTQYSGEFKNGAIFAKGILQWSSADNRQLKWSGITDKTLFVSGKFEVRLNDQLVQTVEGTFNVPSEGVSEPPKIKIVEETKDDAQRQMIPESKIKHSISKNSTPTRNNSP